MKANPPPWLPLLFSSAPVKNPFFIHIYFTEKEALGGTFPEFQKSFKSFFRPTRAKFYKLKDLVHEVPEDREGMDSPAEADFPVRGNMVFPFTTVEGSTVGPQVQEFLDSFREGSVTKVELDGPCRLRVRRGKFPQRSDRWCSWEYPGRRILEVTLYTYELLLETSARCFLLGVPGNWDYDPEWADENFLKLRNSVRRFIDRMGFRVEKVQIDWYKAPPVYYGLEMDRLDDFFRGMPKYVPFPLNRLEHRLNYSLIDAIDELLNDVEGFVDAHWEGVNAGTPLERRQTLRAKSYLSAMRQTLGELENYAYSLLGIPLRRVHHEFIPVRFAPMFLKLQELVSVNGRLQDRLR
ncbi:MAG: hypothetical protein ACTSU5_06340 [Promethearchaeota archaeon]